MSTPNPLFSHFSFPIRLENGTFIPVDMVMPLRFVFEKATVGYDTETSEVVVRFRVAPREEPTP